MEEREELLLWLEGVLVEVNWRGEGVRVRLLWREDAEGEESGLREYRRVGEEGEFVESRPLSECPMVEIGETRCSSSPSFP